MTYDQALAVQRANETELLGLAGVSGVGVKQRAGGLALVVNVDPGDELPPVLRQSEIDGLPLLVERVGYQLQ